MNDSTPDTPESTGAPDTAGPDGRPNAPDGGPLNRPPSSLAAALSELRRLRDDLAATSGRVDALGGLGARVERFTELHNELAAVVSEGLAPEVAALREFTTTELARQAGQLEEVLTTLTRERNAPVNWPALTAEEAEKQWPVLAQWVGEVLVPWYELTRDELPDCWPLHRPALVELSWLRSAHVQAYLPSSPPSVAGEWHMRWRPGVVARLGQVIDRQLCRPGEHLRPSGQSMTDRPAPPPSQPGQRLVPPAKQRADAQHWRENYLAAAAADIRWRRERENPPTAAP